MRLALLPLFFLHCVALADDAATFWAAAKGQPASPWVVTAPVPKEAQPKALPARLELFVPSDAQVWINDQPTTRQGRWRTYASPPIDFDGTYRVRVLWQGREETRELKVRPGQTTTAEITPGLIGWRGETPADGMPGPVFYSLPANCGPTG